MITQRTLAKILLIVVIVMIIIFIVHMLKIKNSEGKGGSVVVHGTYVVSVKPKTQSNPNYGQGSSNCFYFNDIEAPNLVLTKGVYYEFKNESDEPLYFSTDMAGGVGAPGSLAKHKKHDFIGLSSGTIFFLITDDLPDKFYYQSGKNSYMGGRVELK